VTNEYKYYFIGLCEHNSVGIDIACNIQESGFKHLIFHLFILWDEYLGTKLLDPKNIITFISISIH